MGGQAVRKATQEPANLVIKFCKCLDKTPYREE